MFDYSRRSTRLLNFDYSSPGPYFVTICANNAWGIFGEIKANKMILNWAGQAVYQVWQSLPSHHRIELDSIQIMPNHVHFIVGLNRQPTKENVYKIIKGGSRPAPTLGMIVGFFKSESTKLIRHVGATRGSPFNIKNIPIWQRNYWDHIINSQSEYWAIRQYVETNVVNWKHDPLYVNKPAFIV